MSNFKGQISKLTASLLSPIEYTLPIGNKQISINQYMGQKISIEFNGEIFCINCSNKIKKTFMQGYCYPCFLQSPQTSECIFKPHLCKAHLGESRDMEWSKNNCLTDTYVYLSLTSHLKVGVTRSSHIPSRWIDQGAHYAIKFAKTPNRYLAGLIEVALSRHISDRTQWRKMIQGNYNYINLLDKKLELHKLLPENLKEYFINDNEIIEIKYPVETSPEKIKSINLDKNPVVQGKLTGIKGQYLILDNENVFNVRKYTGYVVNMNIKSL
tara:strand:- start:1492 stop:2298 length:807 start_codon:yes stop_codon:yes gene_type:complete